jgi:hypothetical protein
MCWEANKALTLGLKKQMLCEGGMYQALQIRLPPAHTQQQHLLLLVLYPLALS